MAKFRIVPDAVNNEVVFWVERSKLGIFWKKDGPYASPVADHPGPFKDKDVAKAWIRKTIERERQEKLAEMCVAIKKSAHSIEYYC